MLFRSGTEPKTYCSTHVKTTICVDSGQLRSQYCPDSSLIEKVFIQRETPYNPELYPDNKNSSYYALLEASQLYRQIKEDIINGSSADEIRAVYPGMVTLKVTDVTSNIIVGDENEGSNKKQLIEIETVLGYTLDQINFKTIFTEDYQYQVPLHICEYHTYNSWYDSIINGNGNGNGNTGDNEDNGDGDKNPDENGGANEGEPDGDNNNGNDDNGLIETPYDNKDTIITDDNKKKKQNTNTTELVATLG